MAEDDDRVSEPAFREFLLQELAHAEQAFLQNEQDGERRVATFMVVAGAVAASVNFIRSKTSQSPELGGWGPTAVMLALLLLGLATLVRLTRRNSEADMFKKRMNRARAYFSRSRTDRLEFMPFHPFDEAPRKSLFKQIRAGWVPTMCLLLSFVVAGGVALMPITIEPTDKLLLTGVSTYVSLFAFLTWADILQKTWPFLPKKASKPRKG